MLHLRAPVQRLLERVESVTGRPVQVMRDSDLSVMTTVQTARSGASFHVLRYRPTDRPLDYFIAYQVGMLLRQFEMPAAARHDFVPDPLSGQEGVEALLRGASGTNKEDLDALPKFAALVSQWALMTLRSIPVGMRVDDTIVQELPELQEDQRAGIAEHHRQNLQVLSTQLGRLYVPSTLLGFNAAQALHADRLLGTTQYSTPYKAAGALEQGQELLDIFDEVPKDPENDQALIDRWAAACGVRSWYEWTPYTP